MHLEDFTLDLTADGRGGHTVRVLDSPAGEGRGDFGVAPDAAEIVHFFAGLNRMRAPGLGRLRDLMPVQRPPRKRSTARELGEGLFRALFPGEVGQLFRTSQALVAARGHGLRIRIRFDAEASATLHRVPWELIYDPVDGRFLAWSREAPLVRTLELARPVDLPSLPARLSILVLMANPAGTADLDLAAERRTMTRVWKDHPTVDVRFLPDQEGERATFASLRRALLATETHVLHFMGHGGFDRESGAGTLSLEREDGGLDIVKGTDLANLLGDFDGLRLVVLNACRTAEAVDAKGHNPFAGVATALVRGGVPAVVAMQTAISDRAAIAFSQELYHRLARGEPADLALVEGRRGIGRPGKTEEWVIPVLFQRGADGRLFAPADEPRSAVARPDAWSWHPRGVLCLAAALLGVGLFVALGLLWLAPMPGLRAALAGGASIVAAVGGALLHQDPIPGRSLSHGVGRHRLAGWSCAVLPVAALVAWSLAGRTALCRSECGADCTSPGTVRMVVEPFRSHLPAGDPIDGENLGREIADRVGAGLRDSDAVVLMSGPAVDADTGWRCVDLTLRGVVREQDEAVVLEANLIGPGGVHRGRAEARGNGLNAPGRLAALEEELARDVLAAIGVAPTANADPAEPRPQEAAVEMNRMGVDRFQEGDLYAAGASFDRALALDPTYADAANNLGMVRLREGEIDDAAALFRRAIQQVPAHPSYHFNLGLALERGSALESAAAAFRRAVDLDPEPARALNNLGHVLVLLEDYDAARAALDRGLGIAHSLELRVVLRKNLGLLALAQDRPERALMHLDRALAREPDFPEALFLRARALEQHEDGPAGDATCAAWQRYRALADQDDDSNRRAVGRARAASPGCRSEHG